MGINDIFRDLATLVNEQGEVIGAFKVIINFILFTVCNVNCSTDSIESNVETAAGRVESGNQQLQRAVDYKVCICHLSLLHTYHIQKHRYHKINCVFYLFLHSFTHAQHLAMFSETDLHHCWCSHWSGCYDYCGHFYHFAGN